MNKRFFFKIHVLLLLSLGILTLNMTACSEAKKPHFVEVGSMHEARAEHTATLLDDGRVLVLGGYWDYGIPLESAELYNPDKQNFTLLPPMHVKRKFHTATKLLDGRVLIIGGNSVTKTGLESPPVSLGPVSNVEIFDPKTNAFIEITPMLHPIAQHAASLLPDGRVVITGGVSDRQVLDEIVIFDPKTNQFTLWGHLKHKRSEHSMLTLPSGEIILAGGLAYDYTNGMPINYIRSIEKINISKDQIDEFIDKEASTDQAIFLIDNSRIFLPGGGWSSTFNLVTGEFHAGLKSNIQRNKYTATLMSDGKILFAGGEEEFDSPNKNEQQHNLNMAQLYDPKNESFSKVGPLRHKRLYHTAVLLKNGSVLLLGGENPSNGKYYTNAELFE